MQPALTHSIPVSATNSSTTYRRLETTGDHALKTSEKDGCVLRGRRRRIPRQPRHQPIPYCTPSAEANRLTASSSTERET